MKLEIGAMLVEGWAWEQVGSLSLERKLGKRARH